MSSFRKPNLKGRHIWIAEDEGTYADLISSLLRDDFGAEAECFSGQLDAMGRLIKLSEQKDAVYPDAIITDATYAPTPKGKNPFLHDDEFEDPRAGQKLIQYVSQHRNPRIRKIPLVLLTGGDFRGAYFPNTTIIEKMHMNIDDLAKLLHERISAGRGV